MPEIADDDFETETRARPIGIDVNIWIDDWPEVIGTDPKRKGLEPPQFQLRRNRLARGAA